MSLHAILFDHDGTLVDSEATHMRLWQEVVAPYGVVISEETYWQQMLGVPMEQNAADIVRLYSLDADPATLVNAKLAANDRFLAQNWFPEMPKASEVLTHLAQQLRLGLVSGSQRNCVEASLGGHGWQQLFEQVVTGDDVSHNKPHPEGYLKALALMKIAPENCIAVEDTEVGVQAAHSAGLRVIAIQHPLAVNHDFTAAIEVVDSLTEAQEWIASHLID
ncbi:Beta-phosphoglucomutase [Marinobacterium lacunae]|uniref:Beta-phosphoglucomutase n=1 Tax=Marinobacterium lacunae TaxID=1232683 RepID=A0A081FUM8_9GAMM|nr:HAD family phosphatase [Marinobacterium lacunae]KEA62233.1 Beta-phosphoglucomutase [Marinobacterium lacunae]MBR9883432.1 HAD family phosphatase [Oceanospirillales bacterium]